MLATLVSLCLPITIIHDMWAQARGRILSHFPRSLTLTFPAQSMSDNSKTPLKIWFHEFLKCHLHDSKTFCMKILQNLVHPVISGDYSRAHSDPDLQSPFDHHFMIISRENFRASFEKFSCFPEQPFQLPQSQERQLEDC